MSCFSYSRGRRKATHKSLYRSLKPPHSVTSVSVRFKPIRIISGCHVYFAGITVSAVFVMVSKNICTICLENFHTEYGKCVATVLLFSETSDKEFSCVLCEEPVILLELLLELRNVVIQDSEDDKMTACKKNALGK